MSIQRAHLIIDFLASHGWGKAVRHPISGDASFRRYERLILGKKTAVLMDAPPSKEDVRPFVNIAGYLERRGFSSPKIMAQDEKQGFLLLEDLGDDIFTRVLAGMSSFSSNVSEKDLYSAAIDVLVALHSSTLPSKMPGYNDELLSKECELLTDWYMLGVGIESDKAKKDYLAIWQDLFKYKKVGDDVVVLRDYHADNLLWLPEREGIQKVGLLDFQDAVIGSPVYDIVSLLEDARRDVDLVNVSAAIDHYLGAVGSIDRESFMAAYSILAAQRNCKIVGIFARLAIRDNKLRYLDYLPRVWRHIEYDLQHPVLKELKLWLDECIPQEARKPGAFSVEKK